LNFEDGAPRKQTELRLMLYSKHPLTSGFSHSFLPEQCAGSQTVRCQHLQGILGSPAKYFG